ncbi:DUF2577 family protein [Clostridium beijerinckii]|uniref:DUF2577 family protein n=1 Tax=Clostridium beijerinckii TaxID=1520 RepID=UPI000688E20D|nr:DUF2577 family protein [Clostridium beijerinckii]
MNKSKIIANQLIESMNTQFQKNMIDDGFTIGKVASVNPLTINIGDLPLYENDLYINKHLLPWRETCTGLTTQAGSQLHTHSLVYIDHPSKIEENDYVVLYGIEWNPVGKSYQKYCVINVLKEGELL